MTWFGRQKVDLHAQAPTSGDSGSWHGRQKPQTGVGTENPAPQRVWHGRSEPEIGRRTIKDAPHQAGNQTNVTWHGRKYGQMEQDIRAEMGKMPMGYRDDTTHRFYGKSKTDLEYEGSRSQATGVLHIVGVSSSGHDVKQMPYRTEEKVPLPIAFAPPPPPQHARAHARALAPQTPANRALRALCRIRSMWFRSSMLVNGGSKLRRD